MSGIREICVRCGHPTPYDQSTPTYLRHYYIEGSGQMCEECFQDLYAYEIKRRDKDEGSAPFGH